MASVDDLKAVASVKLGFARPNNFLVTLPDLGGTSGRELNVLCRSTSLPGKQVLTSERRIGMEFQKVAYGYAVDDVTMIFYCMNDYGVKKYFDAWRALTVSEEPGELVYKSNYAKTVTIHQLRKPLVGLSKALGPLRLNVGIGGGSVYSIELREAFPTTMSAIELNNELDGLVELSIQMSYTNWYSAAASQNFLNASINTPLGGIDLV
tara:strand:- start:1231 stop:1854 length:624 start_codon:yes stop_codon:yes gene_type:complete